MKVYYRLCGLPSTNPSPIYQDDKIALNNMCFASFVKGLLPDTSIHVIADHIGESDCKTILSMWDNVTIEYTRLGINETCLHQYELAKDCGDDEIILFQECDYYYFRSASILANATARLGLCSPYDHLNFYIDRNLHSEYCRVQLVNDNHWRTAERNTMTFAVRGNVFKKHYEIFKKWGYLDGDVWYDLANAGQPLWTPIPTIATHMVKNFISPTIEQIEGHAVINL